MWELISVTRDDLEINNSYHLTEDDAYDTMVAEMLEWTPYNTIEEIQLAAKRDECELARIGAWAETHNTGTCTWKIVEVPDEKSLMTTADAAQGCAGMSTPAE